MKKRLVVWYAIVLATLIMMFNYGVSNNVWG